jgi:hypothetical protein
MPLIPKLIAALDAEEVQGKIFFTVIKPAVDQMVAGLAAHVGDLLADLKQDFERRLSHIEANMGIDALVESGLARASNASVDEKIEEAPSLEDAQESSSKKRRQRRKGCTQRYVRSRELFLAERMPNSANGTICTWPKTSVEQLVSVLPAPPGLESSGSDANVEQRLQQLENAFSFTSHVERHQFQSAVYFDALAEEPKYAANDATDIDYDKFKFTLADSDICSLGTTPGVSAEFEAPSEHHQLSLQPELLQQPIVHGTLRAGAPDFRPLEEDDRRAVAAVASTDNTTESKFYAVRQGRCPGVYDSWAAMVPHTRGFKRAEFCKFDTRSAAEAWLHEQKPAQVEATPSLTQSEREARIGAFLASIDFEALRDH